MRGYGEALPRAPGELFILTGMQGCDFPACRFAGRDVPFKSRVGAPQQPLPALMGIASCKLLILEIPTRSRLGIFPIVSRGLANRRIRLFKAAGDAGRYLIGPAVTYEAQTDSTETCGFRAFLAPRRPANRRNQPTQADLRLFSTPFTRLHQNHGPGLRLGTFSLQVFESMIVRIRNNNCSLETRIRTISCDQLGNIRQLNQSFWRIRFFCEEGRTEPMRPDVRDKFLALADDSARALGGNSFQEGVGQSYRLFSWLAALFDAIRTPEQLAEVLDRIELSKKEEWFLLAFARFGPHVLRFCFAKLGEAAARTLPALPSRRPAVSANGQVQMLQFINELNFKHDVELGTCMKRAAARYGCGVRTVERIWAEKKTILLSGPEPHFHDVLDGLKELTKSEEACLESHIA
jgi:hypothetical protein